jgi:hypothetical protein
MNPDAFIASTNVDLMKRGRDFDAHYNTQLSADAVPVLLSALPSMPLEHQCSTRSYLHTKFLDMRKSDGDLRSFNWSRRSAFEQLEQSDPAFHASTAECLDRLQFNVYLDEH